jgi:WD40 repeat protein/Tfp pilus assembly protein PilF
LAVATTNSTIVELIDVDTGAIRGELRIPGNATWLDWHPDGEILAVSGQDRRIYLVDSRSGRDALPPLDDHLELGYTCCFSHAGDWLINTDWSGTLRVWDTRTSRQLLTQSGAASFLQFSHDDRLLGHIRRGTRVCLLRAEGAKALRTIQAVGSTTEFASHDGPCSDIDGRLLAVETERGVALIDVARGREVAILALPRNFPFRRDPEGRGFWTHGNAGLLRWPIRADTSRAGGIRIGPPDRLSRARGSDRWGASGDGGIVAIPIFDGASLWHRASNRVLVLGPQEDVRNCTVSPDGRWAATGTHILHGAGGAKVWDTATGRHVVDLPVGGGCPVEFSPAGKWLLTGAGGCRLWEVGTWRQGPKLDSPAENTRHAFTADGKLLALGDQAGIVRLVSPDTGVELARLTVAASEPLLPGCFTPDGRYLAVLGGISKQLYVFDLATLRTELNQLGLDWVSSPVPRISADPVEPIQITVDLGNIRQSTLARDLVDKAAQLEEGKKFPEAVTALREAIKTDPTDAIAQNNLAWLLAAGPKELRDAQAALPLARKAAELEPQTALYLNTLGVALYRNGKYTEAVPVLANSLAASHGDADAFDLFFLAMCHHELGEPAKAKTCYDRAVKWVNEKPGMRSQWLAELAAFQAEAEGLLAHGKAPSRKGEGGRRKDE